MSDFATAGEPSSVHQEPMDLIHTTNGNGDISTLLDNQHISHQVLASFFGGPVLVGDDRVKLNSIQLLVLVLFR